MRYKSITMKTDTRKAGSERDARRATIKDIADQAGVSVGTVSAVINQKASVSNDTRARVLSVIDELNYRPNAAARRRLQRTSQKSIGFVIKEMQNPYFADVIIGVQEVAHARGYNVIVVSSERQSELEHELTELLVAKDVDGLVINPLLDDSADIAHLFELKRRKIPLILLESIRGLSASMVDVNNVQASKHAVEWLIDHGHKRIVHFAGPMYSMHSDERIEGVRRAFSAQQLALTERDVVHAGARLEDGYAAGLAYFREKSDNPPTAVTCYNDLVAIGLMRALRELNIKVPDDVSVIGYDDIAMSSYCCVPLTSVRVPRKQIGNRAAEMLIQHIESSDTWKIERLSLKAELIVRESTRALTES